MKCQKNKCQCLPLQGTHPDSGRGWGCLVGSRPVGKVLVVRELDRRQPCALATREATSFLGCMTRSMARRLMSRILWNTCF